ncbi:SUKH-3 domain-containing protein [Streptomyces sp. NPDC051840]|uniref:SUKH-3 domain-containing protein n=1 Tax=Streptomyces sp. NPDC051840 TaxID=3154752 RepID=UPI0034480293
MRQDEDVLASTGWHEGRDVESEALSAVFRAVALVEPAPDAASWMLFPAAKQALRSFHGLRSRPVGPGRDVAPTGWVIDPVLVRHAGPPLSRLAETTGSLLFPLGRTDADAILAVDEEGRLFSIDHGGQWHLGDTVREGLAALAEGRAPTRIAARRWAWTFSSPSGEPLVDVIRTALVAVYVLHLRQVFSARHLRLTVTPLRGIAPVALDRAVPLPGGSLEESAVPLAATMEALIKTEGVTTRGAELKVEVPAPRNATAPQSSVSCAVRTGHLANTPATVELCLTAGAGASVGRLRTAVLACSKDLARQTSALPAA